MLSVVWKRSIKIGGVHIPLPILYVIFALAAVTFAAPSHAAACGVTSGYLRDYAGVVVESYWAYSDGSIGGSSDNTQVKVSSAGSQSGQALIDHSSLDPDWQQLAKLSSATFNQYDSGCGTDGHNVVLGYGDNTKGWG